MSRLNSNEESFYSESFIRDTLGIRVTIDHRGQRFAMQGSVPQVHLVERGGQVVEALIERMAREIGAKLERELATAYRYPPMYWGSRMSPIYTSWVEHPGR